ncbi:hypothetical protein ACWDA9_24515, partial [Streptomyces sp. NPDC001193]
EPWYGFCGICEARDGGGDFGRAPGVAVGSGAPAGAAEAAAEVAAAGVAVGGATVGEAVAVGPAPVPGAGEPDFSGAGDVPPEQPPSSRPPASSAVTDIGTLP